MLQEFIMIPLDIFRRNMHNKTITTAFEAWLTFLSEDDPEKVIQLLIHLVQLFILLVQLFILLN